MPGQALLVRAGGVPRAEACVLRTGPSGRARHRGSSSSSPPRSAATPPTWNRRRTPGNAHGRTAAAGIRRRPAGRASRARSTAARVPRPPHAGLHLLRVPVRRPVARLLPGGVSAQAARSRPAFGAPSGRAGTLRLARKRSWVEGSHSRTSSAARRARRALSVTTSGVSPAEPARTVVGPRVGAVVGLARDVQAKLLEHRPVLLGRVAERGQEVAHHHAVEPGLDGRRLELAQVLDPAAAQAEERLGEDQAEDRDPLDDLPRVHQLAVAELRAGTGVQKVDRDARRVDVGQLERHLDPLLPGLAEVQDPAHAGLEPGLLDRVDRAQPSLVADRRRHLRVVGLGRLDVVVHALDARLLERPRPVGRHVPDRHAPLEVRVLRRPAARPRGPSRSRASTGPGPG